MNPTVLIATHQRVKITRQNIESLRAQSVVPKIILVASLPEEVKMWKRDYPEITVLQAPNYPLGLKWQVGVEATRLVPCADPLIVTGSDDILGKDFIKNACELSEEFDFVGLYQWHVWHGGFLYKFDYNANIPLGGGRVYSKDLLEKLNWKLFDTTARRHLDDLGYHSTIRATSKTLLIEDVDTYGMHIVAVKGGWPVMNEFKTMMHHPNCSLITKERGDETLIKLLGFKPIL